MGPFVPLQLLKR